MAAANTFGVTYATLQAFVADLTITAASSPNITQVGTLIAKEAETLRGLCKRAGITTDSMTDSDDAYGVLQGILIDRSVASLLMGRQRGEEAVGFAKRAEEDFKRLTEDPQSVDASSPSTLVETVDQWADRTGATAGQTTWNRTPAGRIVSGGSL